MNPESFDTTPAGQKMGKRINDLMPDPDSLSKCTCDVGQTIKINHDDKCPMGQDIRDHMFAICETIGFPTERWTAAMLLWAMYKAKLT